MIDFISSQKRFIYKTVLLFFFFVVAYLFLEDNGIKKAKGKMHGLLKKPWVLFFLFYASHLLSATVMGRYFKNPYGLAFSHFGIRPGNSAWNQDIFNNIIIFIPLTFLYNQAFKPKKIFKSNLLLSLSVTLFIELSQLIGWLGYFQFADMVYNMIGGMIGSIVWCLVDRGVSKKNKQ